MIHCYICYTENVHPEWICDMCEMHYCFDCSYTYSLHYQHECNRCYLCACQSRRNKLEKEIVRKNKINLYVGYIS